MKSCPKIIASLFLTLALCASAIAQNDADANSSARHRIAAGQLTVTMIDTRE
jgi:hypothetical protein